MQKENYEKAVSNYAEDIYRMAFSMVQAKEDAEDILQNVFMKLLMHQKEFNDSDHLRRWLIRVAINECNSLWTSSWRKRVELKEFSERDKTEKQQQNVDNGIRRFLYRYAHAAT